MTERIIIEHRKRGGCLPVIGTVLVVGIAYHYWYVTIPLVALILGGLYWWRSSGRTQNDKRPPQ